ncbi:protein STRICTOSIDINE SYNTHASE-LIKE 10 isoform X2 [Sorghum bicolor]|uniref:protein STRICTOSIDINE SYNTHASE-LIKE 10 isoform X2 n=1 Tax=Sorghum bicolor TaxID=4558 RepID=UPI00081ACE1B|nr:protein STRICTOSIDINE SYNTHASE-LIKE 10 isoform X2 [Sorghum bicolor]|eukprot:XP_021317121.1 protein STRICTOSIDINE SYNTHASE-LIKE 10 isoform X2 [Sorghum bicolor]
MNKMAVLVAAVVVAAAAALLSSHDDDSCRDVAVLEIGGGGDAAAGRRVELVPVDAAGPESLAFDGAGGGPYAGVSDGRVLRWVPGERRWEEHSSSCAPELLDSCRGSQDPGREHECGRPLGLKFNHATGELYVADAYHGLRVVSPDDGKVSRPVAPQWWRQGTGRPFSFANGVELDPETGAVYFTETSTRFQRREFLSIVISGDTTGRLLRYDPKSGEVEVLVDGLAFPNGLAMSRDGTHLLLAETTTGRILRYWLRPPAAKAAGAMEEVARLPWFPDNIRMSPRGGFWVGIHAKRGKIAEWCISYPWLRRVVLSLPPRHVQRASWLLNRLGRQVIAVRLSEEDGKVMEMISVHGDLQKVFRSVSEVEERNGSLWIGSVMSPFLGVYKL